MLENDTSAHTWSRVSQGKFRPIKWFSRQYRRGELAQPYCQATWSSWRFQPLSYHYTRRLRTTDRGQWIVRNVRGRFGLSVFWSWRLNGNPCPCERDSVGGNYGKRSTRWRVPELSSGLVGRCGYAIGQCAPVLLGITSTSNSSLYSSDILLSTKISLFA